jgi:large subunit ribosomal protein L24
VTLDLDARALDGVVALLQRFAPAAAEQLRHSAPQVSPLLLRASITMDPGAASDANARLKVDGRAGPFRLAVLGDAFSPGEALKNDKLTALLAAKLNLIGRLESDDGAALIELAGLDHYVSIDKGPARLALTAKGILGGEIEVDGGLTAGSLAASTNGRIRILPKAMPIAALDLRLSNLNLRVPRAPGRGSPAEILPLSLTTRLALTEGTLRLAAIKGTVAGTAMSGQLVVGLGQPMTVEGTVDLSALDLTHSVAVLIGAPPGPQPRVAETRGMWPTEPFEPLFGPLRGGVGIKSTRVRLTPRLEARDFNGVIRFGESQAALEVTQANLAGGRLLGELVFLRERGALVARTRVNLVGGNAAELLPGDGAVAGRLDAQLSAQGAGMSAVALIGSLEGSINFTLEEGRLARLDPRAFDLAIHAVDEGLPVETSRLRERIELALASGALAVPRTEGAVTISAGQLRGSSSISGEHGSELSVSGRVDLTDADMEARLVLARAIASGGPNAPPGIVVTLKGPIGAPLRSIDVAAFAGWLALRAVDQQTKKIDVLEGREASVPSRADPVVPAEKRDRPVEPRAAPAAVPPLPRPRPVVRPPRARPEPVAPSPYRFWWGLQ